MIFIGSYALLHSRLPHIETSFSERALGNSVLSIQLTKQIGGLAGSSIGIHLKFYSDCYFNFFSSMYLSGKINTDRNYYFTLRQHNGAWLGWRMGNVQLYLIYIYFGDRRLRQGIGRAVSVFNPLTPNAL
jgi:hypothetical protein